MTDAEKIAVLRLALRRVPIIDLKETNREFRLRQDIWLRRDWAEAMEATNDGPET